MERIHRKKKTLAVFRGQEKPTAKGVKGGTPVRSHKLTFTLREIAQLHSHEIYKRERKKDNTIERKIDKWKERNQKKKKKEEARKDDRKIEK